MYIRDLGSVGLQRGCHVPGQKLVDLRSGASVVGSAGEEERDLDETSMLEQARLVAFDTEEVNNLESARFNIVNRSAVDEQSATTQSLASVFSVAVNRQRSDASPLTHHYKLVLVSPSPAGH